MQPDQILVTVVVHLEVEKTEVDNCSNAIVMNFLKVPTLIIGVMSTAIEVEVTNPLSEHLLN